MSKGKVLIIDDFIETAKTFERALTNEDYEVSTAFNGKEGLAKIFSEYFDVIVLDYQMPDIDGLKILEILHEINLFSKTIMVTGHSTENTVIQALQYQTFAYFKKPVDIWDFTSKVNEAVQHKNTVIQAIESWIQKNPERADNPLKVNFAKNPDSPNWSARIALEYFKSFRKKKTESHYEIVQFIFNLLSSSTDIKAIRRQVFIPSNSKNNQIFDVFFCYNKNDKLEILRIARKLILCGLLPWVDEWELKGGEPWIQKISQLINKVKSVAIFFGENKLGSFQELEIYAFLEQFSRKKIPIIPVILSNCKEHPDIPTFIKNFHYVDFRCDVPDPLANLISAITGKKIDLPG